VSLTDAKTRPGRQAALQWPEGNLQEADMKRGPGKLLAVIIGTGAMFVPGAAVASIGGPGTVSSGNVLTETIDVGVRSVSISPTEITICSQAPLTFPNGICRADGITVTNGQVGGHIDVNGGDAVPSDAGTGWTLCTAIVGGTCTGSSSEPGQDEYSQYTTATTGAGPAMTISPQCDTAFDGTDCSAGPGQTKTEDIVLTGPSAVTDTSSTFTTSVTWTAVP
jgi:hypothetical protein